MQYNDMVRARMSAEEIIGSSFKNIIDALNAKDEYIKQLEAELQELRPSRDLFEGKAKENEDKNLTCKTCGQRPEGKAYCPVVNLFRSIHCPACEFYKTVEQIEAENLENKKKEIDYKKKMIDKMKSQIESTKKESVKQNMEKGIEKLKNEIEILEKELF